uniref:Probable glycine cleavage system H protein n=2 Tax=environmental samples TaxID=68359 RepID=A0A075GND1_9EURY|nr:glycine cleavage system H protein (gcvH, GCSH) [uncultured marine group II/III euryarchaeote KM3_160_F12]AIF03452.1 glycine cleavage system H protein (gcvH, GCSH) [uncultured marine group II/III euryarchaeote KM3_167_A05]
MSDAPEELYYTEEHEWLRVEGDEVVVGITDYAQDSLTDIVYVELPEEGMEVGEMDEFASVESVKSVSAIYSPIAGTICAINEALDDAPELINEDPYGEGWIARITMQDASVLEKMLSASNYLEQIGE